MFIGDWPLVSTAVLPPNSKGTCWLCRMPCYAAGDLGVCMAVFCVFHTYKVTNALNWEKLCFVTWHFAQECGG